MTDEMTQERSERDRGPLAQLRIMDFTENMAGPFGTMILGDQGADVIKVESPQGDIIRHVGSGSTAMSAYFANLNRSKRSLSMNLHDPESRIVLDALLDSADVIIHSFRSSAARRLGLDAPTVLRQRPKLIHASIVGFGTVGPFAERPVYDHVIQATSGMADQLRQAPDDPPQLVRHGLIDKSTGYVLAQSVCASIIQRVRCGTGATIVINMLDVAVSMLWPDAMMDHTALKPELRMPSAALTFRLTTTSDGHVAMVVLKQSHWDGLITALALEGDASRSPGEILRAARIKIARTTTDAIVELLTAHDVPCTAVVRLEDVASHPQVIANEILVEYDHPLIGPICQPRSTPRFASSLDAEIIPAPGLGEHSRDILAELGFSSNQSEALIVGGTVIQETR